MSQWQRVNRCKECGRISKGKEFCKCGAVMLSQSVLAVLTHNNMMTITDHCEVVVARRRFFKWEVKEAYKNDSS